MASGVVQIPHELQGLGLDPSHALSRAGYRLVLLGPANEVVDLSTGRLDKLPGPATKTAAREGAKPRRARKKRRAGDAIDADAAEASMLVKRERPISKKVNSNPTRTKSGGSSRKGTATNPSEPAKSVLSHDGKTLYERPDYSYAELAALAIRSIESKTASVQQIYDWISDTFPFYACGGASFWKNCIRHNLSMKKCFKRVTGVADNKLWTMADEYQTTDYEGIKPQRSSAVKPAMQPKSSAARSPAPGGGGGVATASSASSLSLLLDASKAMTSYAQDNTAGKRVSPSTLML